MAHMREERPSSSGGLFHMRTPDQYRKFAEECQRWAREAKTEAQQKILQQMADVWRMLADDVAKRA